MRTVQLLLATILLMWIPGGAQQVPATMQNSSGSEAASAQRKEYQQEVAAKLRELDREIDDLNAKAAKQGKETRKEFNREMAELGQKRAVARQRFESLKTSSQEAWRDMKPGIDAAMKDLESAYRRAASHFK